MGGETSLEFPSGPLEHHVRPAVCFWRRRLRASFLPDRELGNLSSFIYGGNELWLMPLCLAFDRREFEFPSFWDNRGCSWWVPTYVPGSFCKFVFCFFFAKWNSPCVRAPECKCIETFKALKIKSLPPALHLTPPPSLSVKSLLSNTSFGWVIQQGNMIVYVQVHFFFFLDFSSSNPRRFCGTFCSFSTLRVEKSTCVPPHFAQNYYGKYQRFVEVLIAPHCCCCCFQCSISSIQIRNRDAYDI